MNLFTQTVDSSLWVSRACDDAEYDIPSSKASPAVPTLSAPLAPAPSTLIFTIGALGAAVASSHSPASPSTLASYGETPVLSAGATAALVSPPDLDDDYARAWARGLISASGAARVVVICGVAAHEAGEGMAVLGEGKVTCWPRLREPAMLSGVAAACVCEGIFAGAEVVGYVEGMLGGGMQSDGVLRACEALDAEIGEESACEGRVDRVRKVVREEGLRRNSHGFYT